MGKYEIEPAFEMLLEELERVIPELNSQIGKLTAEKKFDQAQTVLDKAKQVTAIQQKVRALREEWQTLNPPVPKPLKLYSRPKSGTFMNQEDLRVPILQALVRLNGRAHCQTVFKVLEETIGDQFSEEDWRTMPSNDKEIRWINSARWSRLKMVKDGLLVSKTPHGIWEITPLGRQVLEESHKKYS